MLNFTNSSVINLHNIRKTDRKIPISKHNRFDIFPRAEYRINGN